MFGEKVKMILTINSVLYLMGAFVAWDINWIPLLADWDGVARFIILLPYMWIHIFVPAFIDIYKGD